MNSEHFVAYSDGGARGAPGKASCAVYLPETDESFGKFLGIQTNNYAEYQGLIMALEMAIECGACTMSHYADSELMVRQIKGIYQVKSDTIRPLYLKAKELIAQLDNFEIFHVYREANSKADAECNRVLDAN